jgi:hypothetical protein
LIFIKLPLQGMFMTQSVPRLSLTLSPLQIHFEKEIQEAASFAGFVSGQYDEINGQDGEQNEFVGQCRPEGCPCLLLPGIRVKSEVPTGTMVFKRRPFSEKVVNLFDGNSS